MSRLNKWRGPEVRLIMDAVYDRLAPDVIGWHKRTRAVGKLHLSAIKNFNLPGQAYCPPALIGAPHRKKAIYRCKLAWCPHCYARRLLALFQGLARLRVTFGKKLAVGVERWLVPLAIFDARPEEVWAAVKPVRPSWLPARQGRAYSWTILVVSGTNVIITRRTVGSVSRSVRAHARSPALLPWGVYAGRTVTRISTLKPLVAVMAYPSAWLLSPASVGVLRRLEFNAAGRRRTFSRHFGSRDDLVPVPRKKKPRRRRLSVAQKLELQRNALRRFCLENQVPYDQLSDAQRELLGLPPIRLVVNNETGSSTNE